MKRIALAGGASCGKTSLARHLTTELYNNQEPKRNAQQVIEFARDYINGCRRHQNGEFSPCFAEQLMFFNAQLQREDDLPKEVEFLITDSPVFLSLVYALPMVDFSNYQQRQQYLFLENEWLKVCKRYDQIFVLAREKDFFQDGTRGGTKEGAEDVHERVIGFLNYHEMSYANIAGSDEDRVEQVLEYIL